MKSQFGNDDLIILAHRGGGGEAPENSIEAFRQAVAKGYGYLETDVRLGTDGKLYLHHGLPGFLSNRLLPANSSFATLEELFKLFPKQYFSIDPKHEAAVEPLAKLIIDYTMIDRVCIVSAVDRRIERVAQIIETQTGERPCTALCSLRNSLSLIGHGTYLDHQSSLTQASFIDLNKHLVTAAAIQKAHNHNLKLVAWTVNDLKTMQTFIDWGIDGFMTDFPSLAMSLLPKAKKRTIRA